MTLGFVFIRETTESLDHASEPPGASAMDPLVLMTLILLPQTRREVHPGYTLPSYAVYIEVFTTEEAYCFPIL